MVSEDLLSTEKEMNVFSRKKITDKVGCAEASKHDVLVIDDKCQNNGMIGFLMTGKQHT